jgi:hypothetical protein
VAGRRVENRLRVHTADLAGSGCCLPYVLTLIAYGAVVLASVITLAIKMVIHLSLLFLHSILISAALISILVGLIDRLRQLRHLAREGAGGDRADP